VGDILRVGRLAVYVGKIERGNNGSNPSWRGYCWGSDWPRARFQSDAGSCYCLDLSWLMYFASIYWQRGPMRKASQPAPPK
jgi:hypothetical protein